MSLWLRQIQLRIGIFLRPGTLATVRALLLDCSPPSTTVEPSGMLTKLVIALDCLGGGTPAAELLPVKVLTSSRYVHFPKKRARPNWEPSATRTRMRQIFFHRM